MTIRWRLLGRGIALGALLAVAARGTPAQPPVAQPLSVRHGGDARFATLEHEYVTYVLAQFPVVATYLGGAAYDPTLAAVDGKLRDYSAAALQQEDARLGEFRARFAALAPANLSARRRIDRSVALAQLNFLLHEHAVRRHQLRSLDSYVDEPFRGVDWQIQAMRATGAATYGSDDEWRAVIARTRAVSTYLAVAEQQLAAGVQAHDTPDWRVLRDFGLQSSAADADYFAKTLPQIAAADIVPAHREALVRELQEAGNQAASAYRHLRDFVATTFFADLHLEGSAGLKPAYRSDRFAFGAAEYDWALHNNLHVNTTAAELYTGSWGAVQATRAEMVTLRGRSPRATAGRLPRAASRPCGRFSTSSARRPAYGCRDGGGLPAHRAAPGRIRTATGLFDVPADYRLEVTETPPPCAPRSRAPPTTPLRRSRKAASAAST